MKISDITEARMGAKDLFSTDTDGITIGFEVEIACDEPEKEIDDDAATEAFDRWYESPSDDEIIAHLDSRILRKLKTYEPKYGWNIYNEIMTYDNTDENAEETDPVDIIDIMNNGRYAYSFFKDAIEEHFEKSSEIMDFVDDMIQNARDEHLSEAFNDFMANNADEFTATGEDAESMADNFLRGTTVYREYNVTEDSSIEPAGAELVSEVYDNVEVALLGLEELLFEINASNIFYTNKSTGLHINVGHENFDEATFDKVKFLLFLDEGYATKLFDRQNNNYTAQLLRTSRASERNKTVDRILELYYEDGGKEKLGKAMDDLIREMNNSVEIEHQRSVDFGKLSSNYIEVRVAGGYNYEDKFDTIKKTVYRIIRAFNIARDPNAYKKEYYKKIFKYLTKTTSMPNDLMGDIKKIYGLFGEYGVDYFKNSKSIAKNLPYRYSRNSHVSTVFDGFIKLYDSYLAKFGKLLPLTPKVEKVLTEIVKKQFDLDQDLSDFERGRNVRTYLLEFVDNHRYWALPPGTDQIYEMIKRAYNKFATNPLT